MEYRNELRRQLAALVEMIDSMSMSEEGLPLIEKDIILERLRGMYAYVSGCPTTEVVAKAEVEKNDRADAENTIEAVAEKPADATTEAPADTSTETPADKTAEEPVAEPIFAPAERVEKVDSVAQPIMDDVKDEGYEKLFEEEPVEEALEPTTDTEATAEAEPSMEDDTEVEEEIKQEVAPEPEETIEPEEATAHEPEPNPEPEPEPKPAEEPQKEPSEKAANTELSLFEYLTKSQEGKRPQTIGDKFGQNHAELGDKLTQQATQHKVTDLRTVININDKFSFVGALFHNNMRAYTDFILRLNAIDNRDEAMQYIGEVAQQNNWNMNSIEVKTFNKILDRKF